MSTDKAFSTFRALDLALEALESCEWGLGDQYFDALLVHKAITAIKQARSAPVQEPVAWGIIASNTGRICQVELDSAEVEGHNPKHIVPLYTTPPAAQQAVPLTDEQIDRIIKTAPITDSGYVGWILDQRRVWARAIEAAHGITKGQP